MKLTRTILQLYFKAQRRLATDGPVGVLRWAVQPIANRGRIKAQRLRQQNDPESAAFDLRHGVDTAGKIELTELKVPADMLRSGQSYQASSVREFTLMMRRLPISPGEFTFIDLGCGKGRVLMLASEMSFARIIGVEYSKELCATAEANHAALRRADLSYPVWELLNMDAGGYEFPSSPLVVYMWNPFDAEVMERVVARLEASLAQHPRPVYVAYLYPKQEACWQGSRLLCTYRDEYGVIYANASSQSGPWS